MSGASLNGDSWNCTASLLVFASPRRWAYYYQSGCVHLLYILYCWCCCEVTRCTSFYNSLPVRNSVHFCGWAEMGLCRCSTPICPLLSLAARRRRLIAFSFPPLSIKFPAQDSVSSDARKSPLLGQRTTENPTQLKTNKKSLEIQLLSSARLDASWIPSLLCKAVEAEEILSVQHNVHMWLYARALLRWNWRSRKRNGLTPRGTPLTRVLEWWVVAAYNNVPHNSSQSNSRGTEGEGLWGSAAAKGVIAFVSSLINVVVVASFFVLVAKSQRKSVHLFMVIILRIFLRIHSFLAWVALPDIFPFCGGALWNWLLPRFRHSNSTLFSSSSFPLIWSPAAAAAERERSASTMIMVIPLDDDDRRDGWLKRSRWYGNNWSGTIKRRATARVSLTNPSPCPFMILKVYLRLLLLVVSTKGNRVLRWVGRNCERQQQQEEAKKVLFIPFSSFNFFSSCSYSSRYYFIIVAIATQATTRSWTWGVPSPPPTSAVASSCSQRR